MSWGVGTLLLNSWAVLCYHLLGFLDQMAFSDTPVWKICVKNLIIDDISQLLGDSCLLSPRLTFPLACEIDKKTGGCPIFVKQLLKSLHDERLLFYFPSEGRWQWHIAAIRSKSVPDNAVALLEKE